MTRRYLLDTCVLSEPVSARPHPLLTARLRENLARCATAAPVWHELWYGACRLPPSRRREALERYLRESVGATLPILPYDDQAARWHAEQRARLAAAGRSAPFVDGQIAAVATAAGRVLVTCNVFHFAGFEELEVVDWRVPD